MKLFSQDGLFDNIQKYVQIQIALAKLEVQEKIEQKIKIAAIIGSVIALAGLVILFLLIGLALYLNTLFASSFIGFWIVALILIIILLMLAWFLKVHLILPIQNKDEVYAINN
jgi:Putative Actinobacterial Holin-X, holin superfamily III